MNELETELKLAYEDLEVARTDVEVEFAYKTIDAIQKEIKELAVEQAHFEMELKTLQF